MDSPTHYIENLRFLIEQEEIKDCFRTKREFDAFIEFQNSLPISCTKNSRSLIAEYKNLPENVQPIDLKSFDSNQNSDTSYGYIKDEDTGMYFPLHKKYFRKIADSKQIK